MEGGRKARVDDADGNRMAANVSESDRVEGMWLEFMKEDTERAKWGHAEGKPSVPDTERASVGQSTESNREEHGKIGIEIFEEYCKDMVSCPIEDYEVLPATLEMLDRNEINTDEEHAKEKGSVQEEHVKNNTGFLEKHDINEISIHKEHVMSTQGGQGTPEEHDKTETTTQEEHDRTNNTQKTRERTEINTETDRNEANTTGVEQENHVTSNRRESNSTAGSRKIEQFGKNKESLKASFSEEENDDGVVRVTENVTTGCGDGESNARDERSRDGEEAHRGRIGESTVYVETSQRGKDLGGDTEGARLELVEKIPRNADGLPGQYKDASPEKVVGSPVFPSLDEREFETMQSTRKYSEHSSRDVIVEKEQSNTVKTRGSSALSDVDSEESLNVLQPLYGDIAGRSLVSKVIGTSSADCFGKESDINFVKTRRPQCDAIVLRALGDSTKSGVSCTDRQMDSNALNGDGDGIENILKSLHETLNSNTAKYSCPHCSNIQCCGDETRYHYRELVWHLLKLHGCVFGSHTKLGRLCVSYSRKETVCEGCCFRTHHSVVFMEHVRHHVTAALPYQCTSCDLTYDSSTVHDHFKVCKNMAAGCSFGLSIGAATAELLWRHRFACPLCGQGPGLLDLAGYVRHLYNHGNFWISERGIDSRRHVDPYWRVGRQYVCFACAFRTVVVDAFVEHLRCHLTAAPYSCVKCKENFSTPDLWWRHTEECTDSEMAIDDSQRPQMEKIFHRMNSRAEKTAKSPERGKDASLPLSQIASKSAMATDRGCDVTATGALDNSGQSVETTPISDKRGEASVQGGDDTNRAGHFGDLNEQGSQLGMDRPRPDIIETHQSAVELGSCLKERPPDDYDLVLLRFLAPDDFKVSCSDRQIMGGCELSAGEEGVENMFKSLQRILLSSSAAKFRCPCWSWQAGGYQDCPSHNLYEYEELVWHILHSHGFVFGTHGKLGELNISHMRGQYLCEGCCFRTPHAVTFLEHVRHHVTPVLPYRCTACKANFDSSTVRHHFKVCVVFRERSSFKLNLTGDTAALLLRHRFFCPSCSGSGGLYTRDAYLRHLSQHARFEPVCAESDSRRAAHAYKKVAGVYHCETCRFRTEIADAFVEHVRCHLVAAAYSCAGCEQKFTTPELYWQHKGDCGDSAALVVEECYRRQIDKIFRRVNGDANRKQEEDRTASAIQSDIASQTTERAGKDREGSDQEGENKESVDEDSSECVVISEAGGGVDEILCISSDEGTEGVSGGSGEIDCESPENEDLVIGSHGNASGAGSHGGEQSGNSGRGNGRVETRKESAMTLYAGSMASGTRGEQSKETASKAYELLLLRVLNPGDSSYGTSCSDRQTDSSELIACEKRKENMLNGLRKILGSSAAKYRCPYRSWKTGSDQCCLFEKRYSYAALVWHLMCTHGCSFKGSKELGRLCVSHSCNQYLCEGCSFKTPHAVAFIEHVRHHVTSVLPYHCTCCDTCFDSSSASTHFKGCKKARDGFSLALTLSMETAAVFLENRFFCPLCKNSLGLLSRATYLRHLYEHTRYDVRDKGAEARRGADPYERRGPVWVCTACDFRTRLVDAFVEHMRCHLVAAPYSCAKCEKAFTTPLLYGKHSENCQDAEMVIEDTYHRQLEKIFRRIRSIPTNDAPCKGEISKRKELAILQQIQTKSYIWKMTESTQKAIGESLHDDNMDSESSNQISGIKATERQKSAEGQAITPQDSAESEAITVKESAESEAITPQKSVENKKTTCQVTKEGAETELRKKSINEGPEKEMIPQWKRAEIGVAAHVENVQQESTDTAESGAENEEIQCLRRTGSERRLRKRKTERCTRSVNKRGSYGIAGLMEINEDISVKEGPESAEKEMIPQWKRAECGVAAHEENAEQESTDTAESGAQNEEIQCDGRTGWERRLRERKTERCTRSVNKRGSYGIAGLMNRNIDIERPKRARRNSRKWSSDVYEGVERTQTEVYSKGESDTAVRRRRTRHSMSDLDPRHEGVNSAILSTGAREDFRSGRHSDETEAPKAYDSTLLRLLDTDKFMVSNSERQTDIGDVSTTEEGIENMVKSLRRILNSLEVKYQCPYRSWRPGGTKECPSKKRYPYRVLVWHMLTVHSCTFGWKVEPGRLAIAHRRGQTLCEGCSFKTPHAVAYMEHVRHHVTSVMPYLCQTCDTALDALTIQDHTKACQAMQRGSSFQLRLNSDTAALLLRYRFVCPSCSHSFLDRGHYVRHLFLHARFGVAEGGGGGDDSQHVADPYAVLAGEYVCRACDFRTEIADAFVEHLRCHLAAEPYRCTACALTFRTPNLYWNHTEECLNSEMGIEDSFEIEMEEIFRSIHSKPAAVSPSKERPQRSHVTPLQSDAHNSRSKRREVPAMTLVEEKDGDASGAEGTRSEKSRLLSGSRKVALLDEHAYNKPADWLPRGSLRKLRTRRKSTSAPDVGKKPVARARTVSPRAARAALSPPQRRRREGISSRKLSYGSGTETAESGNEGDLNSGAKDGEETAGGGKMESVLRQGVKVMFNCSEHGLRTACYMSFLQHIVAMHFDFTKVNRQVADNECHIAFRQGCYVCEGCDVRTPLRSAFVEHIRCHTLALPYHCTRCASDLTTFTEPHSAHCTFTSVVVNPSPDVDVVMQKLGPQAPAISEEVVSSETSVKAISNVTDTILDELGLDSLADLQVDDKLIDQLLSEQDPVHGMWDNLLGDGENPQKSNSAEKAGHKSESGRKTDENSSKIFVELIQDGVTVPDVNLEDPGANSTGSDTLQYEKIRGGRSPRSTECSREPHDGSEEARDGSVEARDGSEEARDGSVEARDGSVEARDVSMDKHDGSVETRVASVGTRYGSVETRDGSVETRDGLVETRDELQETSDRSMDKRDGSVEARVASVRTSDGSVETRDGSVDIRCESHEVRDGSVDNNDGSLQTHIGSEKTRDGSMKTRSDGPEQRGAEQQHGGSSVDTTSGGLFIHLVVSETDENEEDEDRHSDVEETSYRQSVPVGKRLSYKQRCMERVKKRAAMRKGPKLPDVMVPSTPAVGCQATELSAEQRKAKTQDVPKSIPQESDCIVITDDEEAPSQSLSRAQLRTSSSALREALVEAQPQASSSALCGTLLQAQPRASWSALSDARPRVSSSSLREVRPRALAGAVSEAQPRASPSVFRETLLQAQPWASSRAVCETQPRAVSRFFHGAPSISSLYEKQAALLGALSKPRSLLRGPYGVKGQAPYSMTQVAKHKSNKMSLKPNKTNGWQWQQQQQQKEQVFVTNKYDVMLMRLLTASQNRLNPGPRQIKSRSVTSQYAKDLESMLLSLNQTLNVTKLQCQCPLVNSTRCPSAAFSSYVELVRHLIQSHQFKFGWKRNTDVLDIGYSNGRYICRSCAFDTAVPLVFVEHMRHHAADFVQPYHLAVGSTTVTCDAYTVHDYLSEDRMINLNINSDTAALFLKHCYMCPVCGVGLFNLGKYIVHLSLHQCIGVRRRVRVTADHVAGHVAKIGELFMCRACDFCTRIEDAFLEHLRCHLVEFPYFCAVCSEQLRSPAAVGSHGKACVDSDIILNESCREDMERIFGVVCDNASLSPALVGTEIQYAIFEHVQALTSEVIDSSAEELAGDSEAENEAGENEAGGNEAGEKEAGENEAGENEVGGEVGVDGVTVGEQEVLDMAACVAESVPTESLIMEVEEGSDVEADDNASTPEAAEDANPVFQDAFKDYICSDQNADRSVVPTADQASKPQPYTQADKNVGSVSDKKATSAPQAAPVQVITPGTASVLHHLVQVVGSGLHTNATPAAKSGQASQAAYTQVVMPNAFGPRHVNRKPRHKNTNSSKAKILASPPKLFELPDGSAILCQPQTQAATVAGYQQRSAYNTLFMQRILMRLETGAVQVASSLQSKRVSDLYLTPYETLFLYSLSPVVKLRIPVAVRQIGVKYTEPYEVFMRRALQLKTPLYRCDDAKCTQMFSYKQLVFHLMEKHNETFLFSRGSDFVTSRNPRMKRVGGFSVCVCDYFTASPVRFVEHARHHSHKAPYWCTLCGQSFNSLTFSQHRLKCPSKETDRHWQLQLEGQLYLDMLHDSRYACIVCSQLSFMDLGNYVLHLYTHAAFHRRRDDVTFDALTYNGVDEYACSACAFSTHVSDAFFEHVRCHALQAPYGCSTCSESFATPMAFAVHRNTDKVCQKSEMTVNQEADDWINEIYDIIVNRQFDRPVHTEEYVCPIDRQAAGCLAQFLQHLIEKHRDFTKVASLGLTGRISYSRGVYGCGDCGLLTTIRDLFREHLRCHLLSKPYQCNVCGTLLETPVNHGCPRNPRLWQNDILVLTSETVDKIMEKLPESEANYMADGNMPYIPVLCPKSPNSKNVPAFDIQRPSLGCNPVLHFRQSILSEFNVLTVEQFQSAQKTPEDSVVPSARGDGQMTSHLPSDAQQRSPRGSFIVRTIRHAGGSGMQPAGQLAKDNMEHNSSPQIIIVDDNSADESSDDVIVDETGGKTSAGGVASGAHRPVLHPVGEIEADSQGGLSSDVATGHNHSKVIEIVPEGETEARAESEAKSNGTVGGGSPGERAAGGDSRGEGAAGGGSPGERAVGEGSPGERAAGEGPPGERAVGRGSPVEEAARVEPQGDGSVVDNNRRTALGEGGDRAVDSPCTAVADVELIMVDEEDNDCCTQEGDAQCFDELPVREVCGKDKHTAHPSDSQTAAQEAGRETSLGSVSGESASGIGETRLQDASALVETAPQESDAHRSDRHGSGAPGPETNGSDRAALPLAQTVTSGEGRKESDLVESSVASRTARDPLSSIVIAEVHGSAHHDWSKTDVVGQRDKARGTVAKSNDLETDVTLVRNKSTSPNANDDVQIIENFDTRITVQVSSLLNVGQDSLCNVQNGGFSKPGQTSLLKRFQSSKELPMNRKPDRGKVSAGSNKQILPKPRTKPFQYFHDGTKFVCVECSYVEESVEMFSGHVYCDLHRHYTGSGFDVVPCNKCEKLGKKYICPQVLRTVENVAKNKSGLVLPMAMVPCSVCRMTLDTQEPNCLVISLGLAPSGGRAFLAICAKCRALPGVSELLPSVSQKNINFLPQSSGSVRLSGSEVGAPKQQTDAMSSAVVTHLDGMAGRQANQAQQPAPAVMLGHAQHPVLVLTQYPLPAEVPEIAHDSTPAEAPVITQHLVPAEAPVLPQHPVPVETPVLTQHPVPAQTLVLPRHPVPVETPLLTQHPVPAQTPVLPRHPVPVETPVLTQHPVPVETPVLTQHSTPAEAPVYTPHSVVTEASQLTQQPVPQETTTFTRHETTATTPDQAIGAEPYPVSSLATRVVPYPVSLIANRSASEEENTVASSHASIGAFSSADSFQTEGGVRVETDKSEDVNPALMSAPPGRGRTEPTNSEQSVSCEEARRSERSETMAWDTSTVRGVSRATVLRTPRTVEHDHSYALNIDKHKFLDVTHLWAGNKSAGQAPRFNVSMGVEPPSSGKSTTLMKSILVTQDNPAKRLTVVTPAPQQATVRRECKSPTSPAGRLQVGQGQDDILVRSNSLVKFSCKDAMLQCQTCNFFSADFVTFKSHLWMHVHKDIAKCQHLEADAKRIRINCPIYRGLVEALHETVVAPAPQERSTQVYEKCYVPEPWGGSSTDSACSSDDEDSLGGMYFPLDYNRHTKSVRFGRRRIKGPLQASPQRRSTNRNALQPLVLNAAGAASAVAALCFQHRTPHLHPALAKAADGKPPHKRKRRKGRKWKDYKQRNMRKLKTCALRTYRKQYQKSLTSMRGSSIASAHRKYTQMYSTPPKDTCASSTTYTSPKPVYKGTDESMAAAEARLQQWREDHGVPHSGAIKKLSLETGLPAKYVDHWFLEKVKQQDTSCALNRHISSSLSKDSDGQSCDRLAPLPSIEYLDNEDEIVDLVAFKDEPDGDEYDVALPSEYIHVDTSPQTKRQTANKVETIQDSEAENRMLRCHSCDFHAWSKAQLENHVMWHVAGRSTPEVSDNGKERLFACPRCPCRIRGFSDFRFHLQFHCGDDKVKYYECASCSFKTTAEETVKKHHRETHLASRDVLTCGEEDTSYMAKTLRVPFHGGTYRCPFDACAVAINHIIALQEHCVREHGQPLTDAQRLDFYDGLVDKDVVEKDLASALVTSEALTEGESSECDYCAYEPTTAVDLQQHLLNMHGVHRSLPVLIAAKKNNATDERTEKQAEPEKLAGRVPGRRAKKKDVDRYECKLCRHWTPIHRKMRRHVMLHLNYRPFQCPLCYVNSVQPSHIASHLRSVHKSSDQVPLVVRNAKMEAKVNNAINCVPCVDMSVEVERQDAAGNTVTSHGLGTAECDASIVSVTAVELQELQNGNGTVVVSNNVTSQSHVTRDEQEGEGVPKSGKDWQDLSCGEAIDVTSDTDFIDVINIDDDDDVDDVSSYSSTVALSNPTAGLEEGVAMGSRHGTNTAQGKNDSSGRSVDEREPASKERPSGENKNESGPGATLIANGETMVEATASERKRTLRSNVSADESDSALPENPEGRSPTAPAELSTYYYSCQRCPFWTRRGVTMRHHVMMHVRYRPYVCPLCGYAAVHKAGIRKHLLLTHGSGKVKAVVLPDARAEAEVREAVEKARVTQGFTAIRPYSKARAGSRGKVRAKARDKTLRESRSSAPGFKETSSTAKSLHQFNQVKETSSQSGDEVLSANPGTPQKHVLCYKCKHCDCVKAHKGMMRSHVMSHTDYCPIKCRYCPLRYRTIRSALRHRRRSHRGKTGKPIIAKIDEMEKELKGCYEVLGANETCDESDPAPQQGEGSGKYQCGRCRYSVDSYGDMRTHVMDHVRYKPYRCPLCDVRSSHYSTIQEHIREDHRHRGVVPDVQTNPQLEREIFEEVMSSIGQVREMTRTTRRNDSTKPNAMGDASRHQEEDKNNASDLDNLSVSDNRGNAPSHPKKRAPKFDCNQCNSFTTNRLDNWKYHVMKHLKYHPNKCPFCKFRTVFRHSCKDHIVKTHQGRPELPFYVKNSRLETKLKDKMIKYNRSAQGDSPQRNAHDDVTKAVTLESSPVDSVKAIHRYTCVKCGYCARLANMKRHIQAEISYRPYGCPHCAFCSCRASRVTDHCIHRHPGRRSAAVFRIDTNKERQMVQLLRAAARCGEQPQQHPGDKKPTRKESQSDSTADVQFKSLKDLQSLIHKQPKVIVSDILKSANEAEIGRFAIGKGDKICPKPHSAASLKIPMPRVVLRDCMKQTNRMVCSRRNLSNQKSAAVPQSEHHCKPVGRADIEIVNDSGDLDPGSKLELVYTELVGMKVDVAEEVEASGVTAAEGRANSPSRPVSGDTLQPDSKVLVRAYCGEIEEKTASEAASEASCVFPLRLSNANADISDSERSAVAHSSAVGTASDVSEDEPPSKRVRAKYPQPEACIKALVSAQDSRVVERYECSRCTYRTNRISNARCHVMAHLNYRPFKCSLCSFASYSSTSTNKHLRSKHPNRKATLRIKKNIELETKVREGIRIVFRQANQYAPFFSRSKSLQMSPTFSRSPNSGSDSWYRCVTCGLEARCFSSMFRHLLREMGYRRYGCAQCHFKALLPNHVKNHARTAHKGEAQAEPIICKDNRKERWLKELLHQSTIRKSQRDQHNAQATEQESVKTVARRLEPEVVSESQQNYFEDALFERTPIQIPRADAASGYRQCAFCRYRTRHVGDMKSHVLMHAPPHWRCDHCATHFRLIKKLMKHTANAHKVPPSYTNLVTGETCVDGVIASPEREPGSPPGRSNSSTNKQPTVTENNGVEKGQEKCNIPRTESRKEAGIREVREKTDLTESENEAKEEPVMCHQFDQSEATKHRHAGQADVAANQEPNSRSARSAAEGIRRGKMRDGHDLGGSRSQPGVMVEDFMKLPIERLHSLLSQHGLYNFNY